jgi:hypothetical protein
MSSSQEIKRAFKFWTDAADLRIDETNGTPDIAISFERGDHGDGSPFDDTGLVFCFLFLFLLCFVNFFFISFSCVLFYSSVCCSVIYLYQV